jgi:hypothetical protein
MQAHASSWHASVRTTACMSALPACCACRMLWRGDGARCNVSAAQVRFTWPYFPHSSRMSSTISVYSSSLVSSSLVTASSRLHDHSRSRQHSTARQFLSSQEQTSSCAAVQRHEPMQLPADTQPPCCMGLLDAAVKSPATQQHGSTVHRHPRDLSRAAALFPQKTRFLSNGK